MGMRRLQQLSPWLAGHGGHPNWSVKRGSGVRLCVIWQMSWQCVRGTTNVHVILNIYMQDKINDLLPSRVTEKTPALSAYI